MKKRILSFVLSVSLMLSLLPISSLAAGSMPFTDVTEKDWFFDAVEYVYENGMMSGTGNNKFSPNTTTTRGMIVTILHRMEGTPTAAGAAFSDVPEGQWYTAAVAWASANSIVNGYGNDKFGPNDTITREQMAAILYRYSQYKGYDTTASDNLASFSDAAEVSTYAVDAMGWSVGSGLISGFSGNVLMPRGSATRAQVATILMRFCTLYAVPGTVTVTFDACGGSSVSPQKLQSGETAQKPADPTRTGYTFSGWYLADAGEPYDFSAPVTRSIVLYAQWTEKPVSGTDTLYAYDESHVARENGISFINNIILAFTKPNLTTAQKNSIAAAVNGSVVGSMTEVADILQIRVATSSLAELEALADQAAANSLVYTATIDLAELEFNPSSYTYADTDPWGATDGTDKKDWWAEATHCYDAWEEFGSLRADIKVGVVDNGFDTTHSDLNITFPNSYYESQNKLDKEDDGTLSDHGTAVAGLIGAKNNDSGMCGVAYGAELLCVDWSELSSRSSDWFNAYNAILRDGAKIINNSYGATFISEETYNTAEKYKEDREAGKTYSVFMSERTNNNLYISCAYAIYSCSVIKKGWDPLFVQAAGNGEDNSGPGVTASLGSFWSGITNTIAESSKVRSFGMTADELFSHILIVGAVSNETTSKGNYLMTSYSNYGKTVNICAPGGYSDSYTIFTTTIGNGNYSNSSWATSVAAPIVSGAAAFVWSINPSLTAPEVRDILLTNHTVNAVSDGSDDPDWTYPMLDVYAAANAAAESLEDASGILTGYVINSYENPLDNVSILATDLETGDQVTAATDATGKYSIQLNAKTYSFIFEKAGYKTVVASLDLTQFAGRSNWTTTASTITLLPEETGSQTISGIVVDKDTRQPIAGATVRYGSEMYPNEIETVTTDSAGRFTFTGKTVADDWWFLSVEGTDDYSYRRSDNPTAEGENTTAGFCGYLYVVKNDCMMNGMVRDTDGNLIMDAHVVIYNSDLFFSRSTDTAGLFYCWAPPGEYTVSVSKDGYLSYETSITVSSGDIKSMEVTLNKK